MRLRLIIFILSALTAAGAFAYGWKQHPSFDGDISHIVDTPDYVYFTSSILPDNSRCPVSHSLFRYDKKGEEMQTLSTDNLLSCNTVSDIEYCAEKGYLVIVYSNFDIDLVHDNGKVVNIPDYRLASVSYPKNVNSITFSPSADRIYLATDFGYITINDKKNEIAESRVFGEPLSSVAVAGGRLLMLRGNELLSAPVENAPRLLSDYKVEAAFAWPDALYPFAADKVLLSVNDGGVRSVRVLTIENGAVEVGGSVAENVINLEYNRNGVTVATPETLLQFDSAGNVSSVARRGDGGSDKASSYSFYEMWQGGRRRGIRNSDITPEGTVPKGDYIAPDAPAPFISTDMHLHPRLGLLVQNFGFDYNLASTDSGPLLISGYDGGVWTNYAPAYTNPALTDVICRPSGFAVDPDNPDYVYVSSVQNGIARINLKDGSDIIHLSKPSDPGSTLPGFVAFVPDQTGENAWACRFSAPRFDSAGNLWMSYADFDNQTPERLHLLSWEAADRKGTVSATDIHLPKFLEVEGVRPTNTDMVLPLKIRGHENLLVYSTGNYDNRFVVVDTGGTPSERSDDKTGIVYTVYDQDGNDVSPRNVRCMAEDPLTGYVWVGHSSGVFYFNPEDFLNGDGRVTRIKVARNDGTGLADYLLNEVVVNHVSFDGSGRKWFATGGAGVVCLSSDNTSVSDEISAGPDTFPDDMVYFTGYIPETNSMMVSTGGGLAEYSLPPASSGNGESEVRAYPNPVRPGYAGYVTIDGLLPESLVKIADASGNLVKELTADVGGEVKWDVTNLHFKRVGSGVYFVLASGKDSNTDYSEVAKILVVN